MTTPRFLVCIRTISGDVQQAPEVLNGNLSRQIFWCSDAEEARKAFGNNASLKAAWVVSCDEIEPINMAAALKMTRPDLPVFLIQADRTGSIVSRVQAAGIDDVVGVEGFVGHLKAFAEGLDGKDEVSASNPEPKSSKGSGFLLTVMSGGGGVGKSTISVLAARLAEKRGMRTALVDGDLQFGDLSDIAGPCQRVPIESLVQGAPLSEEASNASLLLVEAPHTLEQSEALASSTVAVAENLCNTFDLVVVNTGGNWSEQHALLLEHSAATLLLVDQRASSVRACRHALDLCLRCGIATGSFLFAVNRCSRHALFSSIDVSSALSGAHVVELAEGGSQVEELLGSGMAGQLIADGNPLCIGIDRILDELLPTYGGKKLRGVEKPLGRIRLGKSSHGTSSRRKEKRNQYDDALSGSAR